MIKISQKNAIFNDFLAWICGIQEDEPLPYEICNVYFIVSFSNNDIELSYSADDKNLSIFDFGAYFPQEAEYMFSDALKQVSKNLFFSEIPQSMSAIFNGLKSIVLTATKQLDFLKNKNIFFGKRFDLVHK